MSLVIGLPGDLVGQSDDLDHSATKAGGAPLVPSSVDSAAAERSIECLKCDVCGKGLSLLLQAYAPLVASQVEQAVEDRVIYVFGCSTEGCGAEPGCFKALRLQEKAAKDSRKQRPAAEGQRDETCAFDSRQNSKPESHGNEGYLEQDSWGLGGVSDWGTQMYGEGQQESGSNGGMRAEDAWGSRNSGAVTSSAFSFKDLDDALDSMAVMEAQGCHTPPSSAASKATHPPLQPSKKECGRFSIRLGMAAPPLPEFYIYAEEEGERDEVVMSAEDNQHAERLMAEYQQAIPEAPGQGEALAGESWAGEAYEDDRTLVVGVEAMKFMKRLQRSPKQCARYLFGGRPLWPTASPPCPDPCRLCGGQRVFEMQLMAPLVYFFEEAARWVEDAGGEANAPPTSWGWSTIAIYTCARSCSVGGGIDLGTHVVAVEWVTSIND